MPQWSSRDITSWAPVPAAATTPTGPLRTALAKPRPTPASTAVPAPGPITSRPRLLARRFNSTSSASGTLSLNRSTCRPADRAECAAIAAYGPGYRYHRHVGVRQPRRRLGYGARSVLAGFLARRAGRGEQRPPAPLEGLARGAVVGGADRQHQRVGVGACQVVGREPAARQVLHGGRGGHRGAGPVDPGIVLHGPGGAEQQQRIPVGTGEHLHQAGAQLPCSTGALAAAFTVAGASSMRVPDRGSPLRVAASRAGEVMAASFPAVGEEAQRRLDLGAHAARQGTGPRRGSGRPRRRVIVLSSDWVGLP